MSGWLEQKWNELTGKNQKVAQSTIRNEYNEAYGGARDAYGNLQNIGSELMDPNSARNLALLNTMKESSADDAAESIRLRDRSIAAGGGGVSPGQLAFMNTDMFNKTQSGVMDNFNNILQSQFTQGTGLYSNAINNQTKLDVNQMNAMSQNRLANARIDSQATGFAANMIGGLGQTIFGAQKGGYLRDEDDDDVEFDEDRMEGLQHGDYVDTPVDATYANQPPMDYPEAPQYTMSAGPPRMEDFGLTEEDLMGMMPGVAGMAKGARKIYNIHKAVDKGKGGVLSQWDKDMLKGYITDFLRKKKIGKSIRDNRSPNTKTYEQSRGNPIADKAASRRDHLKESRRPNKAGEQTDLGYQSGDYVGEGGLLSSSYINTQNGPVRIASRHGGQIYE